MTLESTAHTFDNPRPFKSPLGNHLFIETTPYFHLMLKNSNPTHCSLCFPLPHQSQRTTMAPSLHQEILEQLLSRSMHPLFSLPVSPHQPIMASPRISSLSLHTVLESMLHILNLDLPSAHFLLRHMQAAPAFEAMYLHGILHRVEGDLDNARAWYIDVQDSEAFMDVWSGHQGYRRSASGSENAQNVSQPCQHNSSATSQSLTRTNDAYTSQTADNSKPAIERALFFLDTLADAKTTVCSGQPAAGHLIQTSLDELSCLWDFCEKKFGTEPVLEASDIWVSMADKHADIAEKMITGGEG